MWIRSQNGHILENVTSFTIEVGEYRNNYELGGGQYILGRYKTEQRALKVLDTIQNKIVAGTSRDVIVDGVRYKRDIVFNMPKE